MHVRIRVFGKPDAVVVVDSKLSKIEELRKAVDKKFNIKPKLQRLFYGGKLLENGYTFHDYNIKLNDVIQLTERVQPVEDKSLSEDSQINKNKVTERNNVEYRDASSKLYAIGDLIDMRDRQEGAWFEGKIVRIVYDPAVLPVPEQTNVPEEKISPFKGQNSNNSSDKENEADEQSNKSSIATFTKASSSSTKKNGIERYFSQVPRKSNAAEERKATPQRLQTSSESCEKQTQSNSPDQSGHNDKHLLYKIQLDADEEDSNLYCKLKEIRPRARNEVDIDSLTPGQTVLVNHNTEHPMEIGLWFDFKVREVIKQRKSYELVGTLYLGPEAIPQEDRIKVLDKIYEIEEVVPLEQRTQEYKDRMSLKVKKRSEPLLCLKCRDDDEVPCKECGCLLCLGKELPEKIVLCDECNYGFHTYCLTPAMTELPVDDWYCPSCKRDPNDVVAPGAAKQSKKTTASKTKRDWGRGMACVGKTKTSVMPPNHFGPIPGIEVGMCWRFRIQCSECGLHRPPVSGIHGRDVEGAYSIVLSGGYEDDYDQGEEFSYTGSGGRDLSGNKRTAQQSCDQTLTRENKALARNCAVNVISEDGADAGEHWRQGKPVRVLRSYKMNKHFPKYAPKEGIRYDGIYKVVKYYPETGLSGFRVWKYLLRRDDPAPAPWEPHAKQFSIVYPDGYLEAEAEKKKKKENNSKKTSKKGKKKVTRRKDDSYTSSDDDMEDKVKRSPKKTRQSKSKAKKGPMDSFVSTGNSSDADPDFDKSIAKKRPKKSKGLQSASSSPEKDLPSESAKTARKRKRAISSSCDSGADQDSKAPSKTAKTGSRQPAKLAKEDPATAADNKVLSKEEEDAIAEDLDNERVWCECRCVCEVRGRKAFVEHLQLMFLCIICQEVVVNPVTTPCGHNFCIGCMKQALKVAGASCAHCRSSLGSYEPRVNEALRRALCACLPGYDLGRK